ncbi:hypothetical protein SDC9_88126 [bioreactor metagenome]|uniref:Uncharacterized protein n=1 Tax=bioreactor metagenome TaxID=1076179 RepID=A0A644ZNR6_9ZZZZ
MPCNTKLPKAAITSPAAPSFVKINLVEDTFNPSLKSVVMSNKEGNIENSNDSFICIVISKIIREIEIFNINITSSTKGGSGIIKSKTINITNIETESLNKLFITHTIPIYTNFLFLIL